MKKILCIDIGGSKILAGAIDETGSVLMSRKRIFRCPTKENVEAAILSESEAVLKSEVWKEDESDQISGIGVSIPGLADPEKGMWAYAPYSHIENFDVRTLLTEKYHLPVYLNNDGNNCTLGEKRFGVAKGVTDFIWVTVSNGIGSGLFLGNQLFEGYSKSSGELALCVPVEPAAVLKLMVRHRVSCGDIRS